MYSFTICLLILVVGYFVYGRYVERVFGPEAKRPTPALTKADSGIDKGRRSGLYPLADLEDLYDSVFEYCRFGTDLRCYHGG